MQKRKTATIIGAIAICLIPCTIDGAGNYKNNYTEYRAAEELNRIPRGLLSKICFVESGHRTVQVYDTNGRFSEGVCQIQRETINFLYKRCTQKHSRIKDSESCRAISSMWGKGKRNYGNYDYRNKYQNTLAAGAYLRYQFERYDNWHKAIAAYNQGHWNYKRTNSKYVKKVLDVQLREI